MRRSDRAEIPEEADSLDDPLDELLAQYIAAREAGENPNVRALCGGDAGLSGALRARIQQYERIDRALRRDPQEQRRARAAAHLRERLERIARRGSGRPIYRVIERLGEGGMGVVYRVRDDDMNRDLAMKVLRSDRVISWDADPDALQRFLTEAEVTAKLDHPAIVPVHDIGVDADGRPFYVMKLVHGEELSQVLRRCRDGDPEWSLPRLVELLARTCEAIAFAHERGVLHRDLKPSNIMVGRHGEVYVMDWGIARHLGGEADQPSARRCDHGDSGHERLPATLDGDVLGTPVYMSPEQARGDLGAVGPASDIYSMGAILYELLAGRKPYARECAGERGDFDWVAQVLAGPPPPPSRIRRGVPAELEAICLRAMEREIGRRYPSMDAFGRDLRAFLDNRVVSAHRTGAWAELVKWIGRNRLAASVAGLLVVIAAASAWTIHRFSLEREAARAEAAAAALEARRAELVSRFLDRIVQLSTQPTFRDPAGSAMRLLDGARREVERVSEDPVARARLKAVLAGAYRGLGLRDRATELLRESVRSFSRHLGDQAPDSENALLQLAATLLQDGREKDAKEALRLASAAWGPPTSWPPAREFPRRIAFGILLEISGDGSSAERSFRRALDLARAAGDPMARRDALHHLAWCLRRAGRSEDALPLAREALQAHASIRLPASETPIETLDMLALLLDDLGRYSEAAPLHEECIERARASLPEGHADVIRYIGNAVVHHLLAGRPEIAVDLAREALELQRRTLGEDHPLTLDAEYDLARALVEAGRTEEAGPMVRRVAERFGESEDVGAQLLGATLHATWLACEDRTAEAVDVLEGVLEGCHPATAAERGAAEWAAFRLANLLNPEHDPGRVLALLEPLLEKGRARSGDLRNTAWILSGIGRALRADGRDALGIEYLRRAEQAWRFEREMSASQADDLYALAFALAGVGDREGARTRLERILEHRESLIGRTPIPRLALNDLGFLAWTGGEPEVARRYLEQAVRLPALDQPRDRVALETARFNLGRVLIEQGELALARRELEAALDLHAERVGAIDARARKILESVRDLLSALREAGREVEAAECLGALLARPDLPEDEAAALRSSIGEIASGSGS